MTVRSWRDDTGRQLLRWVPALVATVSHVAVNLLFLAGFAAAFLASE